MATEKSASSQDTLSYFLFTLSSLDLFCAAWFFVTTFSFFFLRGRVQVIPFSSLVIFPVLQKGISFNLFSALESPNCSRYPSDSR